VEKDSLNDFIQRMPPDEACLILKDGRPEDLSRLRSIVKDRELRVLREKEFGQSNGLVTLVVSFPPQKLHDLLLELITRGVGGELMGYEAGEERTERTIDQENEANSLEKS
jgi:hypothetical protein